jgi:hypothetical protein
MSCLANDLFFDASRFGTTLASHEQLFALRLKLSGPEHPDTLGAMNDLAVSYDAAGDRKKRLSSVRKLWSSAPRSLGPKTRGLLRR